MDQLLKVLGVLLDYPSSDLRGALPDLARVIGSSKRLPRDVRNELAELIGEMAAADPYDLEEAYVGLFDRGRTTSLHLFEHVHGESRDRGQAMVSLLDRYRSHGYELRQGELPDYLPALLEFLAIIPRDEAIEMLGDCAHILRAIGEALASRGSRYSAVLAALLAIAGEPGLDPDRAKGPRRPERPLDEDWQEQPVIFGPAAACEISSCGAGIGCGSNAGKAPRVFE